MEENAFNKVVADAAQIYSSGAMNAFATAIKELGDAGGPHGWYIELLAGLGDTANTEFTLLTNAYEGKEETPLLAWRARNLLELCTWSMYSEAKKENARRLYEDAGRDEQDIYDLFHAWGTKTDQDASFLDPLAKAKVDLAARAAAEGIGTLEGPYKRIAAAANESGNRDFKVGYKLLSKFAHPTALRIMGVPSEQQTTAQREQFFGMGCLYFAGAFHALDNCLRKFDRDFLDDLNSVD